MATFDQVTRFIGHDNVSAVMSRIQGRAAGMAKSMGAITAGIQKMGIQTRFVGLGLSAAALYPIQNEARNLLSTVEKIETAQNALVGLRPGEITRDTATSIGTLNDHMAEAEKLSRKYTYTMSEIVAAQGDLARSGMSQQDILTSLEPTLQAAVMGQMDVARAAEQTTNVMKGYGMAASDLPYINNQLAYTAANTNNTFAQLMTGMRHAGPVARSLNMDFSETVSALGRLGDAGFQGEAGGTALRTIMIRAVAPTKAAREAYERLGISIDDLYKTIKPIDGGVLASSVGVALGKTEAEVKAFVPKIDKILSDSSLSQGEKRGMIFDEMVKAWGDNNIEGTAKLETAFSEYMQSRGGDFDFMGWMMKLNNVQSEMSAQDSKAIAGVRRFPQFTYMMQNIEELQQHLAILKDENGAWTNSARVMANEMMKNLPGAIALLKNEVELLRWKLWDDKGGLREPILNLINGLRQMLEGFSRLPAPLRASIAKFAAISAAMAPLILFAGLFAQSFGVLATLFGGVALSAARLALGLGKLAVPIKAVAAGTRMSIPLFATWAARINPVGIAISVVGGALFAYRTQLGDIIKRTPAGAAALEDLGQRATALKDSFKFLWDAMMTPSGQPVSFGDMLITPDIRDDAISDTIKFLGTLAKNAAIDLAKVVGSLMKNLTGYILDDVFGKGAADKVFGWFDKFSFSALAATIAGKKFVTILSSFLTKMSGGGGAVAGLKALQAALMMFGRKILALVAPMLKIRNLLMYGLYDAAFSLIGQIDDLRAAWTNLKDALSMGEWEGIKQHLGELGGIIGPALKDAFIDSGLWMAIGGMMVVKGLWAGGKFAFAWAAGASLGLAGKALKLMSGALMTAFTGPQLAETAAASGRTVSGAFAGAFRISMGVVGILGIVSAINSTTAEAKAAAEELGISVTEAYGKIIDERSTDLNNKVREAFKMDPLESYKDSEGFLNELFGLNGVGSKEWFAEWGRGIGDAIMNGIQSAMGSLGTFISGIFNDAMQALPQSVQDFFGYTPPQAVTSPLSPVPQNVGAPAAPGGAVLPFAKPITTGIQPLMTDVDSPWNRYTAPPSPAANLNNPLPGTYGPPTAAQSAGEDTSLSASLANLSSIFQESLAKKDSGDAAAVQAQLSAFSEGAVATQSGGQATQAAAVEISSAAGTLASVAASIKNIEAKVGGTITVTATGGAKVVSTSGSGGVSLNAGGTGGGGGGK